MGRKNFKLTDEDIIFINSSIVKNNSEVCKNCPAKIFTKEEDKIIFGTGNIITNTIFVLREFDPKIANIIVKLYQDLFNNNFIEKYYITFAAKCNTTIKNNINHGSISNCKKILYYEIDKINPINIVLLTSNNLLKELIELKYNINIYTTISPIVYYTNKKLWEVFKKQFSDIIMKIENDNY